MPTTTIRSILAATELGPASDRVVASAGVLAARLAAELHLVHALDLDALRASEPAATFPERVRQAERALAEQAQRAAPGVRPSSLQVINYAPDRAIQERAGQVSADLVAVGPHRGGDAGARLLGTTADRVIRSAEVPCLVAPAPLRDPVRRIGVASDFSEPARRALELALSLAGALGAAEGAQAPELRVLHAGWEVERIDNPGLEEEIRSRLQQEAGEAAGRSGAPAPLPVRTEVDWGVNPSESIVRYAHQAGLDLLVMGTRGTGGLKRLVLGSVASAVARGAPCPVLMVPPPPA